MSSSKTWLVAVSAILFACSISIPVLANGPASHSSVLPGLFGFQGTGSLVPVSDLNLPSGALASQPLGPAFTPAGTDPLQEGTAEISPDATAHVSLQGASANQAYSAYFCRFGFGPGGCILLGQAGALTTDGSGNGHADLAFPAVQTTENLAGLVLITRAISSTTTYEYAGSIQLQPSPTAQTRFTLDGQIGSIDSANTSFVISPLTLTIVTNGSTKFRGKVQSFAGLMDGMQVSVSGVVSSDGTLVATAVTAH